MLKSLNVNHIGGALICLTDCLTDYYFHRAVCKQKDIRRNLTVSQYFRPVLKMAPQPRKTSVNDYSKVIIVVLISYFRRMFIVTVRRTNCNEEQQVIKCSFADSLLKFSTWIDIFIDTSKTGFSNISKATLKSKFYARLLFMVFNGMTFWVVKNSVHTGEFESKNSRVNYEIINKKCWCENEVGSRKLAVPINNIFWKSSTWGNVLLLLKNRGP